LTLASKDAAPHSGRRTKAAGDQNMRDASDDLAGYGRLTFGVHNGKTPIRYSLREYGRPQASEFSADRECLRHPGTKAEKMAKRNSSWIVVRAFVVEDERIARTTNDDNELIVWKSVAIQKQISKGFARKAPARGRLIRGSMCRERCRSLNLRTSFFCAADPIQKCLIRRSPTRPTG